MATERYAFVVLWLWVALAVIGVIALDRVAVWAERRGWIYWRRRPPGMASSALLEIHSLFEPDKKHIVEEQRSRDLAGDQDETGEGRRGGDGSEAGPGGA